MRYAQLRELDALGYRKQGQIKLGVLTLTRLRFGEKRYLLYGNRLFGPSWPVVLSQLRGAGLIAEPVSIAGEYVVFLADTNQAREILSKIRSSKDGEVYIPSQGFVASSLGKGRRRLFFLVPPILILLVFLATSYQPSSSTSSEVINGPICLLDDQLARNTELGIAVGHMFSQGVENSILELPGGLINLKLKSLIGSMAKVELTITCQDGRKDKATYRIDSSGNGEPVRLTFD